jgi:tRNA uridine 5-carboxymethylaminomethyl modification enzyme
VSAAAEIYDLIVVGAGHAGCEAALACARLGHRVLLLTMNLDSVAQMSCNPAIGGLAKGQLVREIDALGGEMAKATDETGIQFKQLNASRGPAVRAPRAQADKWAYQRRMKRVLESQRGLALKQAPVQSLLVDGEGQAVLGVRTTQGLEIRGRKVLLTTGTFLRGLIHIGEQRIPSGRAGEAAAQGLSQSLEALGFELGRLKTGTNPRVDRRSLDLSVMTPQAGDPAPQPFSFSTASIRQSQVLCYSIHTNEQTHATIRAAISRSPLYNGAIKGIGPRYCPSIEDKVMRFPEKTSHQVFLEPEGRDTAEIYLNGLSTSLPEPDQLAFLRTLPGFQQVMIMRPGYAVEYDFVPPTQLQASLETHRLHGLYLAGQINGTSGYEEAAAQGLMAGLNIHLALAGQPPLVLGRDQAFIGVLIDDLVTKGTREPYRLFTSMAEHRLLLRSDNADLRLMDLGHSLGLVGAAQHQAMLARRAALRDELDRLRLATLNPSPELNARLAGLGSAPLEQSASLASLLKRPELKHQHLEALQSGAGRSLPLGLVEVVESEIKYEGYIARQERQVALMQDLEARRLPAALDYAQVPGLSREAREKLAKLQPHSLGQAGRISGVSPADVAVLRVALDARRRAKEEEEGS